MLLPLAVGGLAALVFKPWFHAFRTRLQLPAWAALIAVYVSVAAVLAGFALVFGRLLATQLGDLAQRAPTFLENAYAWVVAETPAFVDFFENHPVGQQIRDFGLSQQASLLQGLALVGGTGGGGERRNRARSRHAALPGRSCRSISGSSSCGSLHPPTRPGCCRS